MAQRVVEIQIVKPILWQAPSVEMLEQVVSPQLGLVPLNFTFLNLSEDDVCCEMLGHPLRTKV